MNKLEELKIAIEDFKSVPRDTTVRAVTQDMNIPLDDRWEVYTSAVDSGFLNDVDSSYFTPFSLGDICLFDEYYIDKYQQYTYDIFTDNWEGTEEALISLKEDILSDGHSAWTHDW